MDMAMGYKFNLTCFSPKKGIFTPHLAPHRQDWLKTDHSWYSVYGTFIFWMRSM